MISCYDAHNISLHNTHESMIDLDGPLFSKGIHKTQLTQEFQNAFCEEMLISCYAVVELKMYKHLITDLIDFESGFDLKIDSSTNLKHRFKCTSNPFLVS